MGPLAEQLCRGHEMSETPCGNRTPYETLIELDAAVLMFGTTMNTHTLFHTAEHFAKCPYLYKPEPLELKVLDDLGNERAVLTWKHDMSVKRRFAETETVLAQNNLLRRAKLGCGTLLFLPSCRRVHEFCLEHLAKDRFYLVARKYAPQVKAKYAISEEAVG